jgi:DNA repair exonuclease SbcCD nuclease subunit
MKLENIRKIFILGDLHLGVRNNSIEWSNIQLEYLAEKFLEQIDLHGFDPDMDILVQLGDWHHYRESINLRIQTESIQLAQIFSQKFKRGVFTILGNHDTYYKDRNDINSLFIYQKLFENFHVFTHPTQIQINELQFLMLPWIENYQLLSKTAQAYTSDVIFCHADVQGFNLNTFTKLEKGLTYSDLSGFKKVYAGHIHIRQTKHNVTYTGTPYQMDRGDFNNTKGFYVLDVSKNELNESFVENRFSPKFLKFTLSDLLELSKSEVQTLFKNNFIDVYIDSFLADHFSIPHFVELFSKSEYRTLDFFTKPEIKESEIIENENYEFNIFTVLNQVVEGKKLDEDRRGKICSLFNEIYSKVKASKNYDQ